jgi:transcription elongation GreA/GreB family factor
VSGPIDKKALVAAVLETLAAQREAMRASAEETRRAATHAEARPENDKDTRGLEQSYLARGQAMRVEALEEEMARLRFLDLRPFGDDDAVALGAVVRLLIDDDEASYFLVPAAGGTKVQVDGREIALVTPAAPLGRSLLGRRVGDELTLRVKGRVREVELVEIA